MDISVSNPATITNFPTKLEKQIARVKLDHQFAMINGDSQELAEKPVSPSMSTVAGKSATNANKNPIAVMPILNNEKRLVFVLCPEKLRQGATTTNAATNPAASTSTSPASALPPPPPLKRIPTLQEKQVFNNQKSVDPPSLTASGASILSPSLIVKKRAFTGPRFVIGEQTVVTTPDNNVKVFSSVNEGAKRLKRRQEQEQFDLLNGAIDMLGERDLSKNGDDGSDTDLTPFEKLAHARGIKPRQKVRQSEMNCRVLLTQFRKLRSRIEELEQQLKAEREKNFALERELQTGNLNNATKFV